MLQQTKIFLLAFLALLAANQNAHAQIEQNYGGLGIQFQVDANSRFPMITRVLTGTPAEQMHLQPNDFITKINNQSTQNLSSEEFYDKIRGSIGSLCYITVWRNGTEYPLSFTRASTYPVWQPGKVDNNYHIKAAQRENAWDPLPGYEFLNPGRLSDLRTVWKQGLIYPNSRAVSSSRESYWDALPGYQFINPGVAGDFRTSWKPGLLHPNYKALSALNEGYWIPVPGYKFVSSGSLEVVWTPGMKYTDSKIISGKKENTWSAFPGYAFTNPGRSLSVSWKAGLANPSNPGLVSGPTEGSWVTANQSTEWNSGVTAVVELGIAALVEYYIGDNMLSDALYKLAIQNGVKYITQ